MRIEYYGGPTENIRKRILYRTEILCEVMILVISACFVRLWYSRWNMAFRFCTETNHMRCGMVLFFNHQ